MNVYKLISTFFLIIFLSSSIYSEGFFDREDNFIYYVNNPTPQIEINIKLPTESVVVKDATLNYNNEEIFLDLVDETIIARTPRYVKKIKLSDFSGVTSISENDEIYFELNVVKLATNSKIEVSGEPLKFQIRLDMQSPILISPSSNQILVNDLEQEFTFTFDEKISLFEIKNNNGDVIVSKPSNTLSFENQYSDMIKFSFESGELTVGTNKYIVSYIDFAGNEVEKEIDFAFKGEDLTLTLLTRKDDSNLKYFYEIENSDFFENKIYFKENEYDLVIQTNKPATCYFSSSFFSFVEFEDLFENADYSQFTSTDGLYHTFPINGKTLVWVACADKVFTEDVIYLNRVLGLGDNLVRFEKYTSNFEISRFYPQAIVSNVPFEIEVITTQDAICSFKFGNSNFVEFLNVTNKQKHIQENINLDNGNHNIEISCYDKLYNIKTQNKNVLIDTESGPRVIGDKTFYTDSSSTPILLQFSEDAICVSSKEKIDGGDFNSTTPINGEGLEKTITPTGIVLGENDYYIYCESSGQLIMSKIEILFDPNQPTIKDLVFVNDRSSSNFLVDDNEIEFEVEYEGLIPVKRYEIEIVFSNFSMYKNFSRSSGVYNGDVSNAKKFKIKLINMLDKTSNTLEKQIVFDLHSPTVTIVGYNENKKITCTDMESGCDKVYYGFSQTIIDCSANTYYELGDEIEVGNNLFICAKGIDFVGNVDLDQVGLYDTSFNYGGSSGDVDLCNPEFDEDCEIVDGKVVINWDDDNTPNEVEVDDNPFTQTPGEGVESTESNALIIAAAVIVLLGGIGGGSYYAYRKGYLDKQLEKFGIFRAKANGLSGASTGAKSSPGSSNMYTPIRKSNDKKKEVTKKTGYDRNLRKINTFIDDTLSKDDDVFASFDSTSKGKTKGYDDTLIKGKVPKKKQTFSLNKNNIKEDTESIEKQAEEFENYFKKKDIKSTDKKGSNKKE